MRDSYLLRYALIPYIYTAAREAYDTGISLLRPMYYDWPEAPEAYEFKDEYMFGDDMLVAPVIAPLDASNDLAKKSLWLPPGTWIEWFTGTVLKGPAKVERSFALDEVPVYVKAGAIIPMQPKMLHTGEKPVDPLILTVFSGMGGGKLYQDEDNTPGYKHNEFVRTRILQVREKNTIAISVLPAEGSYPGMATGRGYEIRLPVTWPPESVSVNGAKVPYRRDRAAPGWRYDGDQLTTVITLPEQPVRQRVDVVVTFAAELDSKDSLLEGAAGRIARVKRAMAMAEMAWPNGWAPDVMLDAAQTGNRITLHPENAARELERLNHNLPEIAVQLEALAREISKMPDNGEGYGFTPQQQLGAVKKAIAHLAGVGSR
jgi:alpha-glucosidase